MAVGVRTPTSGALEATGGTLSVTKPTGLANNDRLLALQFIDEASAFGAPTQTWTTLSTSAAVAGDTHPLGRVLEKKITASGSEPANYAFPKPGYGIMTVMLVALTGVPTDVEIAVAFGDGNFGSAPYNMTAPDVAYSGSNPMFITGFSPITDDGTPVITPPSGFTELGSEIVAPTYAWFVSGYSYRIETGTPAAGPRTGVTSVASAPAGADKYPYWRSVTIAIPGTAPSPPSGPEPGRFLIAY